MTKYTKEKLQEAVNNSNSFSDVARWFNVAPVGGTITRFHVLTKKFEINTSHFLGRGHNKNKKAYNRKTPEDIFCVLGEGSLRHKPSQLRRALVESGVPYECNNCGLREWMDKNITLHVDHIDGDYKNCLKYNLRFLCPNCHSQTYTYCRKK